MAAATLPSSDNAAAMDRRILELLIMMVVIHSLLRKEGANDDDDDAQLEQMKEMVRECIVTINRRDQSAVSSELLAINQQLLDAQLRSLDGGENEGRDSDEVEVSSSASDHHQLMETAAAAKKEEKAAAAAKKKKKRNKRNKAAAKHKGTKLRSWLGGGIISLIMMAAFGFGSITTLNVAFSLIHQSDGSSEGKAPPTLPPTASTSLRHRDLQSSNVASMSPSSVSPFAAVVQAPIFSPAVASNRHMKSEERAHSTCFDRPNWEDIFGDGCKWFEEYDEPGCPLYGSTNDGGMGVANNNCCYCGGGSNTCTDTEGWYNEWGYDCSWYEVMDGHGCPQFGAHPAHDNSTAQGSAKDNCCYCKNDAVSTVSPTKAPSSSGTCVDTPGWKDIYGYRCDDYPLFDDPGCPEYGNLIGVDALAAEKNCCYCEGGIRTCEDYMSKCQESLSTAVFWAFTGVVNNPSSVCNEAASCSCETADHFKIVTNPGNGFNETVGLYNECKCDFWLRLCEETRQGDACDYAAEYCCGDYSYSYDEEGTYGFDYVNSPLCYCDFFNYVQNEFGHTLKPKALNINKEFSNPCDYLENFWVPGITVLFGEDWFLKTGYERESLEAIYNATNGQNWTNNDGWMNETVEHCQWYGISCDDDKFVTSINLRDNNLEGQFPVYSRSLAPDPLDGEWRPTLDNDWTVSKYGLANLFKLKTLDLAHNKLTGTIEYGPLYNLRALTRFNVSGNQLSGEVEALIAPSLRYVDFSNNIFMSMRRFQKYKAPLLQTLRYCDMSNNAIQEDANDILENIPSNIEQFVASNNQIYGSLPESLNNLPKLRRFNMSSNALSGELPGFADSFATLQELDVSYQTNVLTGPISEDIWRSLSLKILNLAGNRLRGTIPSLVSNLAVLEVFDLSNNNFSGIIPSQIGQLQGASVFLKDNRFHNISTAPLSLCVKREVEEFDLANDTTLCPIERNALNELYDSAKGAEWTDGSLWIDEYASCCDWKGVTCDNKNHVTKLNLTNNGLSGRLSESIGNLTFIVVLDLSDNDIKGSIPTEIGKLSNLTYLRLSYNAFTGTTPKELGELTQLQLLQLQSNRITNMTNMPQLVKNKLGQYKHGISTFVTDCGVPSAFEEALECKDCTMCCNANEDCHPQEDSQVAPFNYGTLAAVLFASFVVLCCMAAFLFYKYDRHKNRGINLTPAMEQKRKDEEYALSKIGKNSVYSYFVTNSIFGWVAAVATVGAQAGILAFFILASEPNLQDDMIDIKFAWKCPRDTVVCKDTGIVSNGAWFIFFVLMAAFLAKDIISGFKLIYYSTKRRHDRWPRIRYFLGGMFLSSITLFALYVSAVYNRAIATTDTEMIVNSVIVLFIMELDEWIFSDLEAISEKLTAHSGESEGRKGRTMNEMKEEIALQRAEIESQQEELRTLRESVEKILRRVNSLECTV